MTWTKLSGKPVAVTGGAAGSGLAVAEGFAEVGANLLLADFAEDQGNQAAEKLSASGEGDTVVTCDYIICGPRSTAVRLDFNGIAAGTKYSILINIQQCANSVITGIQNK